MGATDARPVCDMVVRSANEPAPEPDAGSFGPAGSSAQGDDDRA